MSRLSKRARRHVLLKVGGSIFLALLAIGLLGPLLVDSDRIRPHLDNHLVSPSIGGRLGFGVNGIDVMSWLIYGARMSLIVSMLVTTISIIFGITVGALAGFYGGRLDAIMMRIIDIILAFPGILLALYLATVMPPSIFSLIFALSATGWVSYARLVRARVYEIKHREFVLAARALGASSFRIITRHIIPNIMGPVIVQASYGLSVIILAEAGLTFLGLGLPVGTPSWGALLDQGVANLFTSPYLAIFPGICIAIAVLGFNFLGDGLRDILDPKSSIN
jgi:peptide/nickel transport system permease protein